MVQWHCECIAALVILLSIINPTAADVGRVLRCESAVGDECSVVANVKTSKLDSICRRYGDTYQACKEENSIRTLLVEFQKNSQVETSGAHAALVPSFMCHEKFIQTLHIEELAEIHTLQEDSAENLFQAELRAPTTWGEHIICLRTATGLAFSLNGTIRVDCPGGWYGESLTEKEKRQHTRVEQDNFGSPTILAKTFTVEDGPKTFSQAQDFCEAQGMRLCSAEELMGFEAVVQEPSSFARQSGQLVWSDSECLKLGAEITSGFYALSPMSPCTFPDCEESYSGERCWHADNQREPCLVYNASEPSSRAKCSSNTDWRLSEPVQIPAGKKPGFCMNGAECGSPRSPYTVVDGASFFSTNTGPLLCGNYNVSDTSAEFGLIRHGATQMQCLSPDTALQQVSCCRGKLPVCRPCPFGLKSREGATHVGHCSACLKTCRDEQGQETTCPCNSTDKALLAEQQPSSLTGTSQGEGSTIQCTMGGPIDCRHVVEVEVDMSGSPLCERNETSDAPVGCMQNWNRTIKALSYQCSEADSIKLLDVNDTLIGEVSLCQGWTVRFLCPAGWFFNAQSLSCEPCGFGLWSVKGSTSREACAACVAACENKMCGKIERCTCTLDNHLDTSNPFGVFSPLEVSLSSVEERLLQEQGSDACICQTNCTAFKNELCQVQSSSCRLRRDKLPYVFQSFTSGDIPVARCVDILGEEENDEVATSEKYFFLPEQSAMAVLFDELVHPFVESFREREKVEIDGQTYLILQQTGRDELTTDRIC